MRLNKFLQRYSIEYFQEALELGLTQKQMAERFKCSVDMLRDAFEHYNLSFLGSKFHNKGDKNPAKREEVKLKIAKTVSTLWEEGVYTDRINGMSDKEGWEHPNYKGHKWDYRQYLSQYQDINSCSLCNGRSGKIDVHHVDENHDNWLITNLEPLCVSCHQEYHLESHKLPYVVLGIKGSFAGAHNLNDYVGKCSFKHGHEWVYEIKIKKRINPKTGMAIDFKTLKAKVKEFVDDVLDHSDLNEVLPFNPTAENIAVWIFETLSKKALIKGLYSVTLWEAPNSSLEVTKEDMLELGKFNKE